MKIFLQTHVISFIICIVLCFTSSKNAFCNGRGANFAGASSFNVRNYGAIGDGSTDDTAAFNKAWYAACQSNGGVMVVPSGFTFLLQPITLFGNSCPSKVVVQLDGKIVAPNKSQWTKNDFQWILFTQMGKGITIQGSGVIDGNGGSWWNSGGGNIPHVLRIVSSTDVTVTGIKIQNSPRMHLFIDTSQYVHIYNVTISSPADSPNTDGIHLTSAQHVDIYGSNLACGDDCISIQSGSYDVKIRNVNCGPGHGFSIGGLGANKEQAQVSAISVYDSTVSNNALNGVRIKTWPDGSGSVTNVSFSNIIMTDVHNPIVIDQNYCGGSHGCSASSTNAVAISGVTYTGIRGTFTYKSVSLDCSQYKPCRGLSFSSINLTPSGSTQAPSCSYAYGRLLTASTPPLTNCLISEAASNHRRPALPPTTPP